MPALYRKIRGRRRGGHEEEIARVAEKALALCGLRSISPVVDITNFVLLELGQPMHSFDADEIAGRKIIVRRAKEGEKIVTLDEKEFTLSGDNLVICDGNKPVALAGIMGGLNSGIKPETKNVFSRRRNSRATISAKLRVR